MFDLGQLRCFVAAATELNFRRAATLLNMTQPPLSRQIQLLEHSLGVQLFERTGRTVKLTTGGRVFLVDATRLLNLAEQAAITVRRASKGETGRVRIAFTGAAGHEIVPGLLKAARRALPDIDVVLQELISVAQIEAFAANTIDLGFLRPLVSRQKLGFFLVEREPLIVVLPAGHPLADGESVDIGSLNGQPFIMQSPTDGKYFHNLISGLFWSSGVSPDYVQFIDQTHTILSLVRAGFGLAILPGSAQRFHFDNVVCRPLRHEAARAQMDMAWRLDQDNPAVTTFRLMAEDYFSRRAKL